MKKSKDRDAEKLGAFLDDAMLKAADLILKPDVVEAGAKAIRKLFDRDGIQYGSETLAALKVGMQMAISARGDTQLEVPLLMTVVKLVAVEKGAEGVGKLAAKK